MYKTPEKLVVRRRVTPTVVDGEDTGDKIADKMSMQDDVADDFKDAVLVMYPDADLAGEHLTSRSTSGCWIEVASVIDDSRTMGLPW